MKGGMGVKTLAVKMILSVTKVICRRPRNRKLKNKYSHQLDQRLKRSTVIWFRVRSLVVPGSSPTAGSLQLSPG